MYSGPTSVIWCLPLAHIMSIELFADNWRVSYRMCAKIGGGYDHAVVGRVDARTATVCQMSWHTPCIPFGWRWLTWVSWRFHWLEKCHPLGPIHWDVGLCFAIFAIERWIRVRIKFIVAHLCVTCVRIRRLIVLFGFLSCFLTSFPLHSTILEPDFYLKATDCGINTQHTHARAFAVGKDDNNWQLAFFIDFRQLFWNSQETSQQWTRVSISAHVWWHVCWSCALGFPPSPRDQVNYANSSIQSLLESNLADNLIFMNAILIWWTLWDRGLPGSLTSIDLSLLRIVSVWKDIYSFGIGSPVQAVVGWWMPSLVVEIFPLYSLGCFGLWKQLVNWTQLVWLLVEVVWVIVEEVEQILLMPQWALMNRRKNP